MGTPILVLGVLCAGSGAALGLARRARLPAWWAAIAALPLGLTLFGVLVLPAIRVAGPTWGAPLVSVTSAAGLALMVLVARDGASAVRVDEDGVAAAGWGAAVGLLAAGAAIGIAGGRFALATIQAAPTPPLLGDPSTGDWGLHVLRAALIARHGIPPPSPLDPDYPLHYRYLFHGLAAVFATASGADLPTSCAVVTGVVLTCVVLAGGALAYLVLPSALVAVCAGLLAALYGPSYWLPEAGRLLLRGVAPTPAALASLVPEPWPLSPLAPAFPSMLTAQGSSPTLPLAALSWMTALICVGCALRATSASAARWGAGLAGMALAALAFGADFFLPVVAVALALGTLAVGGAPVAARRPALVAGAVFVLALLALLFSAGQLGAAGAARTLRVGLSSALTTTATYGGNHALLAGGTPVPLPNWIHVHDWGLVFWPGLAAALVVALRVRQPVLVAGVAASLVSALVWHLLEITYVTGTPTDTRVQMYRYASLSTALLAPLLPPVGAFLVRAWPAGARTVCHVLLVAVGAGAGLYWVAVAVPLAPQTPPQWAGDVALARRLASEPGPKRFVMLNAPVTFLTMYGAGPGGNLPLWWAYGETPVPVGWDFGYPERYEPLYRRVAMDLDSRAANELGITHVALAPAAFPRDRLPALTRFLAECRVERVASYGAPSASEARELYRLGASTCTPSGAPA